VKAAPPVEGLGAGIIRSRLTRPDQADLTAGGQM
jgi:hypothetical protein